MFPHAETRRTVSILTAVALLAGCSGGPATPPQRLANPSSVFGPLSPDAQFYGYDDVYSAQTLANTATVYKRKGLTLTPVQTLSVGIAAPQGTVATPTGWWYLANAGAADVLVYRSTRKGPIGPVRTLDDGGEVPVDVAVTADRNLVAVSNATSGTSGTGSVSVYLDRGSTPSRVLTYGSGAVQGQGIAIDPQGNCFWSFNDASKPGALGSIVEFQQCSGTGTLVASGIAHAGGMAFDPAGDLYYVDEANGVYKCRQTSRCKLFATGFGLPTNINFDAKHKNLWIADAAGYIDAVNPKTGEIKSQTTSIDGDPYGIAPAPGA